MGDEYEARVLRTMVQEELSPITERTAAVDLAQSFREIFKCMYSHSVPVVRSLMVSVLGSRWLFEVPKILHRDISLNNLMLRKEGDKAYGVLNDFDLAVDADVKSASSKQRTEQRSQILCCKSGRIKAARLWWTRNFHSCCLRLLSQRRNSIHLDAG
jgi:hypothetical protein